ncbi:MAG: MmgE/PrpD family protein [Pseudomonadota bacterium]
MSLHRVTEFVKRPDPPEAARDMAAKLLVDTLAVCAGARDLEVGRIVRDHAVHHLGGTGARLLFDGRRAGIPGAAFAAASQTDNLDAHDGLNLTKGHIGCAVIPALFAFAEGREVSGLDALDLTVMAYEVAARAAMALHGSVEDYHTSGAWNGLGVAALGWRMLGAPEPALREALGIAEYHGPRSQMMREIANPTMLHDGSGMGAMTGAMAALLAADGFTGAPAITVEGADVANVWDDLGEVWTITQNYIKPYPICRWAHAALDALGGLVDKYSFGAADVARIEVSTFAEAAALFPSMPDTTSQAQYSLRFALASLLRFGRIGPEHVAGHALQDAETAAWLPRIDVSEDPTLSARFPAERVSEVTVHLADGNVLRSGVVTASGGPEAPMSEAALEAKVLAMASPTLGAADAGRLWEMRTALIDKQTPLSHFDRLLFGVA